MIGKQPLATRACRLGGPFGRARLSPHSVSARATLAAVFPASSKGAGADLSVDPGHEQHSSHPRALNALCQCRGRVARGRRMGATATARQAGHECIFRGSYQTPSKGGVPMSASNPADRDRASRFKLGRGRRRLLNRSDRSNAGLALVSEKADFAPPLCSFAANSSS